VALDLLGVDAPEEMWRDGEDDEVPGEGGD
jgi:hypothetical protein